MRCEALQQPLAESPNSSGDEGDADGNGDFADNQIDECVDQLKQRLEGRLHFAADFVEAVDTGKLAAPPLTRDTVLRMIQQTVEWRKKDHTSQELVAKIEHIDKLMTKVVDANP